MAYIKQTWENLPSTNTPISAERLNHMEDGIALINDVETQLEDYTKYDVIDATNNIVELKDKDDNTVYPEIKRHIITASLNSNITISKGNTIPFNNSIVVGNRLTFSGSKIKIGANVSKVLVSAFLQVENTAANNNFFLIEVLKNNVPTPIIARMYKTSSVAPLTNSSSSRLLEVTEGDEITAKFDTTIAGSSISISAETFLTVEVVE